MTKSHSALWLIGPGAVLILLGIAVVIEPRILVWIVAIVLVVMGLGIIMMSAFMRRFARRF